LQATRKKEITIQANLVKGYSYKKKMYENNNNNKKKKFNDNKSNMFKPKPNNFKKKRIYFVCGKPGHIAPQCRKRVRNNNPLKIKVNMVEGEDIIIAVVSQVRMVTNEKN
jgi:hypothetical protein